MSADEPSAWAPALDAVASAVRRLGARGWIVGGAPRDALLDRPLNDIDLAVTCAPAGLAEALRPAHRMGIGHLNRHTLRVVVGSDGASDVQIDVSPLRGADVRADLARRDFTCNALALPLDSWRELLSATALPVGEPAARRVALPSLLDPLDGARDLAAGVLRPASDSAFADEPGRILRAARMVATFGFIPSPETYALAAASAHLLAGLSPDRVRDEMNGLLKEAACAVGVRFLVDTGALRTIVLPLADPAAARHAVASIAATRPLQDQKANTPDLCSLAQLAALPPLREWYASPFREGVPRVVGLRWGLLLHAALPHPEAAGMAMAAEEGRTIQPAVRARFSAQVRAMIAAVAGCAAWGARLATREPTLAELRRVADRLGDNFVDLLTGAVACDAALPAAPLEGLAPDDAVAERAGNILARFFADRTSFIPPPLLDGQALMSNVGVPPGPALGRVLRTLREAQLDGEIATREEAIAFARRVRDG